MMSQCGPRCPNLNETKMRRRYDVACRVGRFFVIVFDIIHYISIFLLHEKTYFSKHTEIFQREIHHTKQ